jgi:hypothetical protein
MRRKIAFENISKQNTNAPQIFVKIKDFCERETERESPVSCVWGFRLIY